MQRRQQAHAAGGRPGRGLAEGRFPRREQRGAATVPDQAVDVRAGRERVQPVSVAENSVARGALVFIARELHAATDPSPPSIAISAPVMNEASSLARNAASLATSSARPYRPSGIFARMPGSGPSGSSMKRAVSGV